MQIVNYDFKLEAMKDNAVYLFDVSYDSFSDYRLLLKQGNVFYSIPINCTNGCYEEVLEKGFESKLEGFYLEEIKIVFKKYKDELIQNGLDEELVGVETVVDYYNVIIYLYTINKIHNVVTKHEQSIDVSMLNRKFYSQSLNEIVLEYELYLQFLYALKDKEHQEEMLELYSCLEDFICDCDYKKGGDFEEITREHMKYLNTDNKSDIVSLEEIKRRFISINKSSDGFDEYVSNGFCDSNGIFEYEEVCIVSKNQENNSNMVEIIIETDCMDGMVTAIFLVPKDREYELYQESSSLLIHHSTLELAKEIEKELGIELIRFFDVDDSITYDKSVKSNA